MDKVYRIEVTSYCDPIDWRAVRCLKSTISPVKARERLQKLATLMSGKAVVLENSVVIVRATLQAGKVIEQNFVGDSRKKEELEHDLRCETRTRMNRGWYVGRRRGDVNYWILKGGSLA